MKCGALLIIAVALGGAVASVNHAVADSELDRIEAELGGRAGELERVRLLLADPDPDRRVAAMELLLQSDDDIYRQRAREFGLFSDDPTLRRTAVHAIFDAGGAFRIEMDPVSEDSTNTGEFLQRYRGSRDSAGNGSVAFVLTPGFHAENVCWTDRDDVCRLQPIGDTIHLTSWRLSGGRVVTGDFELDNAGTLQGHVLIGGSGAPVAARIPLVD